MTSVYLIRHAQAEGNVSKRFQGLVDLDLTELGHMQARQVAWRMGAIPLNAVYSSPLRRAMDTAKYIADKHGLEVQTCPGVIEINGGDMEDVPMDELTKLYPEPFHQFIYEPHLFEGVGGESFRQVYDRVTAAILELVARHDGQNIAVVSHGASIRAFLCFASGLPFEELHRIGWGKNTGVNHITFHEGNVMLHSSYDTSHLDPELDGAADSRPNHLVESKE